MADTEFLSFLVEETLKLHSSGVTELSHLETKLEDYRLEYIKGEFIPQTQVLRFQAPFGLFDVPINWSLFAQDENTLIDEKTDNDLLLAVLKTSWNEKFEKLLMTHNDGFCYLVGLKSGEESHVRDLLNPPTLLKAG